MAAFMVARITVEKPPAFQEYLAKTAALAGPLEQIHPGLTIGSAFGAMRAMMWAMLRRTPDFSALEKVRRHPRLRAPELALQNSDWLQTAQQQQPHLLRQPG
ncbi:MAG: hypothetical protein MRY74_09695 [Neomegalonema sp.]|nr:hypothetical protein [Neomegalonema sp.]